MRHSMSKDTAFNSETTPRHTFLCSDSQCLPPGDPRICYVAIEKFKIMVPKRFRLYINVKKHMRIYVTVSENNLVHLH